MPVERRKFERLHVSFQARMEKAEASGLYGGEITNISLRGCYVKTPIPVEAGSTIRLEIHLPTGRWLSLRGIVVRRDSKVGFGIRFRFRSVSEFHQLEGLIRILKRTQ